MIRNYSIILILLIVPISGVMLAQAEKLDTSSYWHIDMEDIVITAQYAPTSTGNTVHEIRIIESEQLEARGFTSLDEVLQNQLNMRINTDPILGKGLEIQGIGGQHIKIMIDGVPVIGRLNGNIDLSQILLNNVDRIEIIEGALSAVYGSNASGGVVNIITKKDIKKNILIQAESQYESMGIWNHRLNLAGSYKGFSARLGGNLYKSLLAPVDSLRVYKEVELPDGSVQEVRKIPWNPKDQVGAYASLNYRVSDSLKFSYSYRYFNEVVNRYGQVRRPQFKPYSFDERFTTGRQDHSLRVEAYLNENMYLKSLTTYNQYNRFNEKLRRNFATDTLILMPEQKDTSIFYSFLHRTMLSYVSEGDYNGMIGIETNYEGGMGERIVDSSSTHENYTSLVNAALWTSFRYTGIENLVAQVSLRYGYNSEFSHPLLPSIHLSWDFMPAWNIKMSYTHGYRAPALKELFYRFIDVNHYILGNSDLDAEKSRNASFLMTYERKLGFNHRVKFQLNGFYNKIKNSIVLAQLDQLIYTYQNIREYGTHGLDLTALYKWRDRFQIKSGIGFLRVLNLYVEEAQVPYLNQVNLQTNASYMLPDLNLTFYASHKFVGNQRYFYIDGNNDIQQGSIGSYNYLDASVRYVFFKDHVSFTTGVKNILDVQSIPISGNAQDNHTSSLSSLTLNWGRSYFVALGLSFDY